MEEQTAIEFLVEELSAIIGKINFTAMQGLLMKDAIEKAKEMEKKQIMDSFNKGLSFAINPIPKPEDAKNYYKKRIKKTNDR
jgi:phage tail tape-measure protein